MALNNLATDDNNSLQIVNDILESLLNAIPNSSSLILGIGTVAMMAAMLCTFSKLIRLQYQCYTGKTLTFYKNKDPIPAYKPTESEADKTSDLKISKKH
jgi:hypothetical protein